MRRWPPIPDTPVLNPIDNPNGSSGYTVSWQPAYLAGTYTLQEATDADFTGAVTRYSGTGTSWTATGKAPGTYYYRVKATNSWGDSAWSERRSTAVWPTVTVFAAVGDAMISSGYSTSNYGSLSLMRAGYVAGNTQIVRSLVQFDLSAIPAGTPIAQARLYLYLKGSQDGSGVARILSVHRATSAWNEMTVTWDTRPGPGDRYGWVSIPHSSYGWYQVEVTNLVDEWVNGAYSNLGMWLVGEESSNGPGWREFSTREDQVGRRPYLHLTYGGSGTYSIRENKELLFVSPLPMPETFDSPLCVPQP